ncbi:hypothetical protein Tco_0520419 [Tanacetum coccineum]
MVLDIACKVLFFLSTNPFDCGVRGGTGERVGSGRRGRRTREGNNERVDELNGQGNDQGMGANKCVEGVNGNVERANGGAVLTHWIEKMEYVHDVSGCSNDQKVKYTVGSFVGKALTWWNSLFTRYCPGFVVVIVEYAMVGAGHAAYTDRFHELARLVLIGNFMESKDGLKGSCVATILQSFSATLHISNIDYMYIKSYSFRLFSSLPVSHLLWSSQSFGHQKGACPWSTENHFNSQYMKHWASQSFGT